MIFSNQSKVDVARKGKRLRSKVDDYVIEEEDKENPKVFDLKVFESK